jgi:hypothetical protein
MTMVYLTIGFVVGFFTFPALLILLARLAPNDDDFIRNYRTPRE